MSADQATMSLHKWIRLLSSSTEQLLFGLHELPNRQTSSMSNSVSVSKSDGTPVGEMDLLDSLYLRVLRLEENRNLMIALGYVYSGVPN